MAYITVHKTKDPIGLFKPWLKLWGWNKHRECCALRCPRFHFKRSSFLPLWEDPGQAYGISLALRMHRAWWRCRSARSGFHLRCPLFQPSGGCGGDEGEQADLGNSEDLGDGFRSIRDSSPPRVITCERLRRPCLLRSGTIAVGNDYFLSSLMYRNGALLWKQRV